MGGSVVALALSAAEVTISVLGLFRPTTLIVGGAGRTVTVTKPMKFDGPGEWTIEVPGRISRRFTGRLRVESRDGLHATITMDLETAVASVVAAELPVDAPEEALKAAAVLARSFYTASGRTRFCDTTHCQFLREPTPASSRAAKATAGIVVKYRGRPVPALYSASCGGSTRTAAEVAMPAEAYPYFSVRCDRCEREEKPWTKTAPASIAGALLNVRSEQARLKLVRALGWSALPGNNYRVRPEGDMLVFTGSGQGHGVGVCQRGAIGMAEKGASYREILRHYLPDTTIE
jgi:stage II sporulation protein D